MVDGRAPKESLTGMDVIQHISLFETACIFVTVYDASPPWSTLSIFMSGLFVTNQLIKSILGL